MDETEIWPFTDARRAQLVAFLSELDAADLDRPSLCDGWTVRDVAAHLTLAEMGAGHALRELARARGSLNRMIHDTAVRRAATWSMPRIIDGVAATVGSHRHAVGVTAYEPLVDALVHGADMAVPLRRDLPMDPEAAGVAASRVWSYGRRMASAFGSRPRDLAAGHRLVATDLDWSRGDGPAVAAPIEQVLLHLTGRTSDLAR